SAIPSNRSTSSPCAASGTGFATNEPAPAPLHLHQVQARVAVLCDHGRRNPGDLLLCRATASVEPDLSEGRRAEAGRRHLRRALSAGDTARRTSVAAEPAQIGRAHV